MYTAYTDRDACDRSMKKAKNLQPVKTSESSNDLHQIIIILGTPRSGTTLAAAIFDAHEDTAVCYEPWNRSKKLNLSPRLSPQQLADYYKQAIPDNATTFVIKETSISLDALRWVSSFIEYNCDNYDVKIVWTVRKFSHSYLSLIERGREWWGNTDMSVNLGSYNRWLTKANRASNMIVSLFKASPGLIYSYEALVENPSDVIRKIMESSGLSYSDKLISYYEHVPKKNIRGDRNIQKSPGAIQNTSIATRDKEWSKYEDQLKSAEMHEVMTYLNNISEEILKKKYIETFDQFQELAISVFKANEYKAVTQLIAKQLRKKLSIIVVVYSMPKQAMNTIYSLSCHYQKSVTVDDYEIIVIENKSEHTLDEQRLYKMGSNIRYQLRNETHSSPVFAINAAVELSRSKFVAIMIDGARMLSPGVVRATLDAIAISKNSIVAVPGYHLGSEPQQHAIKNGYNEEAETHLLQSIDWKNNGYKLFDIACFSGSSAEHGILQRVPESNFLTLPRKLFIELGGYDESFNSHGGGYANLDMFKRVCEQNKVRIFSPICEGTFHQYHGGATTGGDKGDRNKLMSTLTEQYKKLRGEEYTAPEIDQELIGKFRIEAKKYMEESLKKIL